MYALGVTGTYLGDYFGILMEKKVEGFPFNVTDAPMYWGSTLSFLGTALYYGRAAGVFLTLEVFLLYLGALQFEEYDRFPGPVFFDTSADSIVPSRLRFMRRRMPGL